MLKKAIVLCLTFYRNYLSCMKMPCCRFYPSCSQYAIDAITKYGVGRGLWRGMLRLCRCHPFSPGGYDPA